MSLTAPTNPYEEAWQRWNYGGGARRGEPMPRPGDFPAAWGTGSNSPTSSTWRNRLGGLGDIVNTPPQPEFFGGQPGEQMQTPGILFDRLGAQGPSPQMPPPQMPQGPPQGQQGPPAWAPAWGFRTQHPGALGGLGQVAGPMFGMMPGRGLTSAFGMPRQRFTDTGY